MKNLREWIEFHLKHYGPKTISDLADARWLSVEFGKAYREEKQRSTAQVLTGVRRSVQAMLLKRDLCTVNLGGLEHVALPSWEVPRPAVIHVCSYSTMPTGRANCGHHGGTVDDAVKPLRWMSDDPAYLNFLSVSVTRYWGQGVHWHVRVTGEDDALWHHEGHWFRPWDDSLGGLLGYDEQHVRKGFSRDDKFNTIAAAEAWIERTINAGFPGEEVWVRFEGEELNNRTWSYREGD